MSISEYEKKRTLNKTPEPADGKPKGRKLHFVVQKHAASRLHYDFRLEVNGVLKSWAIPKGPTLNPAEKRLAMHVEDHPYDYKDFEGKIPKDNYGAGTVIIWDQGTYEPVEGGGKKEQQKILEEKLQKGSVKFRLNGERLQGEFSLVRTKKKNNDNWLLIKHRDEHADGQEILAEETSVVSGKTLEEMAADENAPKWTSSRNEEEAPPADKKDEVLHAEEGPLKLPKTVKNKKKSEMPADLQPMLATLVDKPVEGDWIYEVKWDGFRALAYLDQHEVNLRSRNNKDFNQKFYPIHDALRQWNLNAVFDGEVVVLNKKGLPDFAALQNWRSEADGHLAYFIFDILWLNGKYLMDLPLQERRAILEQVIPEHNTIKVSEKFDTSGDDFFNLVEKMGLEGMMAKKADSTYQPGNRTRNWLKIKTQRYQEVVIGGYTINENTPKQFSALLMGLHEKGKFVYTGAVGTGFNKKNQGQIMEKLKPLHIEKPPFEQIPEYNKASRFRPNPPKADVFWVKPEVVAEIAYQTISSDGIYRHPSFKGLREDKSAGEVVREKPQETVKITDKENVAMKNRIVSKDGMSERKSLLNPTDETQVREIGGRNLRFTNLSKIFWPEAGVTKRDMLNYYYQIAPHMLPYLQGRPQTLNRYPNGIEGKSFYQKDVTGKVPDWLEKFPYYSQGDQREKQFAVITDEASLLYLASLACIEINPWSSRMDNPDCPDWCIIDLDPDGNPFEKVVEAAQVTHEVLDAIGIRSFVKSSGSTGLHIYFSLGNKYTYEESKEFGRSLVKVIHKQIPGFTSIERYKNKRQGKLYLDFLQNRPQATVAAPYSLRPKPGAPVSMPLHWEEVKKGLKIQDYNIFNALDRVKNEGDLFKGLFDSEIDMSDAEKRLEGV